MPQDQNAEPSAEEWVRNLDVLEVGRLDGRLGLTDLQYEAPDPETLSFEVRQKVYHLLSEKKKKKAESDAAQDASRSNDLKENPFFLLNVNALDSRARILDQVQSRSLIIDEALCQKSASTLTNPRTRLTAEISWFTGIDSEMSKALMRELERDLLLCSHSLGLDSYPLTKANIISAALERYNPTEFLEPVITQRIMRLCQVSNKLNPEPIMKSINRDREKAGFTLVQNESWVGEEIENRKKHYKKVLTNCIDRMPTEMMIRTMTTLATSYFKDDDATPLFNELIDAYELGAQSFLNKEFENLEKLVDAMTKSISSPYGSEKLMSQSHAVLRNWCKVARPIQINMHHRGLPHSHSERIMRKLRSLSIDLCNDHGFYNLGERITGIMLNTFDKELSFYPQLEGDLKQIHKHLNRS